MATRPLDRRSLTVCPHPMLVSRGTRKRSPPRTPCPVLLAAVVAASFLMYAMVVARRAWRQRRYEWEAVRRVEVMRGTYVSRVGPPDLGAVRRRNAGRTVYLLPGRENRCEYRFDYVCKFWFYIRCYVLGGFAHVEMLNAELPVQQVRMFTARAREGDVALVIWRSKNHAKVPEALTELREWRRKGGEMGGVPRVRVGVLHIANEVERENWPWYAQADFVVRNYWIAEMPRHATFIPLGQQMPHMCVPRDTRRAWFGGEEETLCECGGLGYKRASERRYLWNFSGSLRKKRGRLLRLLREAPDLREKGYVQVVKKFGGNGVFGSIVDNPKNEYLQSILESRFVFAPCGNAMETHRIYEALALGAIPIIENCSPHVSHFFPFRELLVDGEVEEMVQFLRRFVDKPAEVDSYQQRVAAWWRTYTIQVAQDVSDTIGRHVAPQSIVPPRTKHSRGEEPNGLVYEKEDPVL